MLSINKVHFCAIVVFAFVCIQPVKGQDSTAIVYKATAVTESIYLLSVDGQPGTDNLTLVVGDDGLLLIDSGFPESEESVRAIRDSLGVGKPLKYLVNTHYHHAHGNELFGHEATIIAHENVRERMQIKTMMYGMMETGPWPGHALPSIVFDNPFTLYFGGDKLRFIPFPGAHTDGDIAIYFEQADVLVAGDLFASGILNPCDYPNGCEWNQYVDAVGVLVELSGPNTTVIPGHGTLATASELKEFHNLLLDVTALVTSHINAGKDLTFILEEGLPERWSSWQNGPIPASFFLTNVFNAIEAGK